ncbi:MAG: ATP-binding protein, partial [Candidatus Limnocylindrales bacterium]
MDRVPTGTVTLVFTDIEGSTQLLQALGPSYGSVLAEHHRILGDAFREQDGVEQGTAGDGLYFVFPTARGALLAAIAGQRRLAAHAWPDGSSVRVRMGIHTGEPTVGETGLVGLDVHRAARIGAVGHGGQVLVSQTTRDLAVGELDADIGFADLGEHQLKDLPGSQHLYQVVADGLAGRFADLRTVAAATGNLPRQLTTFVGRDAQLASGRALLTTSALVTLTGPGGVGKTRLAVRLAAELADGYEDGAWLVELGALTEPALVATAVADTLGIMEQPGRPLASSIVDHLRGRSLLLVLDNCEHLLAACAELVHATLIAARGVRVLATSQEALGIAGEALIAVPSLTVPTVGPDAPAEDILACDAVQLFLERARAAAPGFELSPRNSAAIIQICRRLDGIPLAIELAAARLRALSVEQIAARLDDRFRLLTGGRRVAIHRHQTLRAAVDWSF